MINNIELNNKIIILSDTHLGNNLENLDYLRMVYDFAYENEIYSIYHCGDLIDKVYNHDKKEYKSDLNKFYHVLYDYPYIDTIKTNILLGDHDYYYKDSDYINIISSRSDLNIMGFRRIYINWLNFLFSFNHRIKGYNDDIEIMDPVFNFSGHRHTYFINENTINVPTLSDISICDSIPGFLFVELNELKVTVKLYTIDSNRIKDMNTGIVRKLTMKEMIK